ncbi:lysophospholipid acyltransferase family protein [Acidisarcina polymorpha]|nr:lysophospholipid acyltransferase family protein [Acidisarcina polymorpha]
MGFSLHAASPGMDGILIVSNHLSYLDILLYGANSPCVFVAKSEVRSWPLLGLLASLGGTVFVDRTSTIGAAQAAAKIQSLLHLDINVLIFPEGTSSDGSSVLRFYPSLFEPAVRAGVPILPAAIGYSASSMLERDLCYYGDISFGPHLLQTLELPDVSGMIRFATGAKIYSNRKDAALAAHLQVVDLRSRILEAQAPGAETLAVNQRSGAEISQL